MAANAPSRGLRWIAAIAAVALLAALAFVLARGERSSGAEPAGEMEDAARVGSSPARAQPSLPPAAAPVVGASGGVDAGASPGLVPAAAPEAPRYPVDLERLRAELPDNLYWELGAPTDDPEVRKKRADEERRWNDLYGKVLSNTASEEEIHRYYDRRRWVSEDYIQFASRVLEEYRDELPERDIGLYELSIRMHRTRLDELPRQIEDALARKRAQDQRREEWLRSTGGNQTAPQQP